MLFALAQRPFPLLLALSLGVYSSIGLSTLLLYLAKPAKHDCLQPRSNCVRHQHSAMTRRQHLSQRRRSACVWCLGPGPFARTRLRSAQRLPHPRDPDVRHKAYVRLATLCASLCHYPVQRFQRGLWRTNRSARLSAAGVSSTSLRSISYGLLIRTGGHSSRLRRVCVLCQRVSKFSFRQIHANGRLAREAKHTPKLVRAGDLQRACTDDALLLHSRDQRTLLTSYCAASRIDSAKLAFPRCGEHPHGIADLNRRLDGMPCFHGSLLRSKSHSCVGVDVQGLALGRFQCTCFVKTPAQANRLAVR